MKNQVRNTAILGLFLIMAVVSVQAQTLSGEVKIPFDFYAGTEKMQAGTYVVKRMSDNALGIRRVDGKKIALINAPLTIGARDSKSGQRVVFNRYGEEFFISQVWLTEDSGRQVIPTKQELRVAKEHREIGVLMPQRTEIAMVRR